MTVLAAPNEVEMSGDAGPNACATFFGDEIAVVVRFALVEDRNDIYV